MPITLFCIQPDETVPHITLYNIQTLNLVSTLCFFKETLITSITILSKVGNVSKQTGYTYFKGTGKNKFRY